MATAKSTNPFLKLPDEIQLNIVNCLQSQVSKDTEQKPQADQKHNPEQSNNTHQRSESSPNHPTTSTQSQKAANPPLLALSSTCKFFRALLIPHIFRSVTLRENGDSGAAVRGLLDRGYGEHVRALNFVAYAEDPSDEIEGWETEVGGGDAQEEEEEEEGGGDQENVSVRDENVPESEGEDESIRPEGQEEGREEQPDGDDGREEEGSDDQDEEDDVDPEELMSTESYSILSDLKRFPHLHTLVVTFDMDLSSWDESIHILINPETPKEVRRREENQQWRMLLRKTFAALSENEPGCCKALKIRNLVPKEVSAWKDERWRGFLGGLLEVDISIMGGDNGAGWNINTQPGYGVFTAKMPAAITDHLHRATSFTLAPHLSGPVGGENDVSLAQLPLSPRSSLSLKSLTLKHYFIDQILIDFLVAHPLLERVELDSCYAFRSDYSPDYGWKTLFTSLASAEPPYLQIFIVSEMEEDISFEESSDGRIKMCEIPIKDRFDRQEDSDEIRSVRHVLEEERNHHGDRGKRLFSYRTLDTKYGAADADEEENRAMFLKGEDWAAYLRVIELTDRNRQRLETEKAPTAS